ncbi:MAG: hypothetical protein ABEL76_16415 [Bradymonadaceae bacterium]
MPDREIHVDRRKRRSDEVRQAITYQLEHLAEEYNLENLTLGDNNGILIACAGRQSAGEALAAYAPVFRRHLDRGQRELIMDKLGTLLPGVDGKSLDVRRFELQGDDHYLCVVGEQRLCRQANLYRAVTGIRRIVRDTATAA